MIDAEALSIEWNAVDLKVHDDLLTVFLLDMGVEYIQYLLPGIIKSSVDSDLWEAGTLQSIVYTLSGQPAGSDHSAVAPYTELLSGYEEKQLNALRAWLLWIRQRAEATVHPVPVNPAYLVAIREADFVVQCRLRALSSKANDRSN